MLAIAPSAPVMSLLAITSCSNVTAAMITNATTAGPNATRRRSRAWWAPGGSTVRRHGLEDVTYQVALVGDSPRPTAHG